MGAQMEVCGAQDTPPLTSDFETYGGVRTFLRRLASYCSAHGSAARQAVDARISSTVDKAESTLERALRRQVTTLEMLLALGSVNPCDHFGVALLLGRRRNVSQAFALQNVRCRAIRTLCCKN